MNFRRFSENKWFNLAAAGCVCVAFYVLLTNIKSVLGGLGRFIGYFRPVILGMIIAYIMNPLAKLFYYRFFRKLKIGKGRWILSVSLAVIVMLLAVALLMGTLIPQLVESFFMLTDNFDAYSRSLRAWLENVSMGQVIEPEEFQFLSGNALASISSFLKENSRSILSAAANSGKHIVSAFIALILAIYLLIGKKEVMGGFRRFLSAIFRRETYHGIMDFLLRCDVILVNYIVRTLLDSLIIGTACAVFMIACGMPYAGLISVVVGVTNLIPNFGPVIGGVIGGFILLLVNPRFMLLFVIFICLIQFIDGYILKPRLFADSMGVSGLTILTSTIVLGNMFGVRGILLAIPAAAVLSFVYHDYFLPWAAEQRKSKEV